MPANSSHLADVVNAVRTRITTLNALFGEMDVEIGNPAQFHPRSDSAPPLVTIFVYRLEPDNVAMLPTPNSAAAMRLHTMITVYCSSGASSAESAGSLELRILSHIVRLFHENNELGPIRIREAVPVGPIASLVTSDLMVQARQMAPDMEEINHIWTTQSDTPYRTSLVYKFSFGVITPSQPSDEGPPVLRTSLQDRNDLDPTSVGVTPKLIEADEEVEVAQGVLSVNVGTSAAPQLLPTISFEHESGDLAFELVGVTEDAEPLDLRLEKFDQDTGQWTDISGTMSIDSFTTLAREVLQGGGPVISSSVTIIEPRDVGVLRLSAFRSVDPASLAMSQLFIVIEDTV